MKSKFMTLVQNKHKDQLVVDAFESMYDSSSFDEGDGDTELIVNDTYRIYKTTGMVLSINDDDYVPEYIYLIRDVIVYPELTVGSSAVVEIDDRHYVAIMLKRTGLFLLYSGFEDTHFFVEASYDRVNEHKITFTNYKEVAIYAK